MKKIITMIMLALTSVFMTGCELSKDSKIALLTQSVRLASVAGVKVAVAENANLKDIFILAADIIDKTVDGSTSEVDLPSSISEALKRNLKNEYKGLIILATTESVNLLSMVIEANKDTLGDNWEAIKTIAKGISTGIRLATAGETVSVSPEQLDLFKL